MFHPSKTNRYLLIRPLLFLSIFLFSTVKVSAGESLTINKDSIPKWNLPKALHDNWLFYPIEWQKKPLSETPYGDFSLKSTIRIDDYIFEETSFDTAQYMRYMSMVQFHFQGGIQFRYQNELRQYRLQFSVKDKSVALWKTPGNFLAAVDYPLEKGKAFELELKAIGSHIEAWINGEKIINVVDRFDPILKGRIFGGANHAKISFEKTGINPDTGKAKPAAKKHSPKFKIKKWCEYTWVFDGDEPIARISEGKDGKAWSWHPISFYSAKFRPGSRAADTIMLQYHSKENWPEKLMEIIDSGPDKIKIKVYTSDRKLDKKPTTNSVCEATITYDPIKDAYYYDLNLNRKYLKTRAPIGEILDPWPYSVSGPAYPQAKQWDYRYKYVLWQAEDGKYYYYPLNHFLAPVNNKLNPQKPILIFAGENDVNPTYEIISSSHGKEYKIGLCAVMWLN